MIRKILFFCLLIGFAFSAKAQLSDLHYLPPLKQGQNNAGIRQQAVYLSTPEPTPFTVNIYRGTNPTPIDSYTISNVNPEVYSMSNGDNNIILVNNANTGVVLTDSGLRFESPSGNRFYVNYRGSSNAQSASLTSKGRVAMGTRFKWGGVPNRGSHSSKSNTLGIMATEDNTVVNLFGYDPGCEFRVGNNRAGITANSHQITLDANESFVYETYIGTTPTQAHEDGWIGASIVSDKDIVISNGSMNYGRVIGSSNRDAGIDQPVPENRLGMEYVFVRGNGGTNGNTEFPLLIAIADNTQIRINGSATPIATINNGEYFQVPGNLYSGNTAGANMLVETSKDVYAYQCMAGDPARDYTQGLNFVAPVNCLLPDVMDNIPDIRNMAGTIVTGGMTIIAAVNTPDANITVTDGNGAVTLPASNPVAGSVNWKTFYIPNLNGNVSVQSTGPMAVGFFGSNSARGVAGYFSGFDTVPEVSLEIRGGTGCFVGSEIYEATDSNFDAFQWYKNGEIVPGANSPSYAPDGAGEYFLMGTKGPCTYPSNSILGLYCDPDIHIEKTVDKAEINEGETATFTIRIQNWGVGPLTNLQVTDNIPTGLSLVSNFTLTGSFSGNTWNIGTLNGGEVAELELEVQADEIDTLPLLSLINTATHTQDQTDTNLTEDTPSARIVVHNDYDNDSVNDITDLDDDNDGIYDDDECSGLSFNVSNGSAHTSDLISVENYLILDVFSLDNSFNLQMNGNDLAGEIQFENAPGNFARFLDGTGYGEGGNPQIYTLTGSHSTPLIRVVVDQSGQFNLFGSRTSNGPLEPMVLTTPANAFTWNGGTNNITIGQNVAGPTNIQGVLLTASCDTDSDGLPDHLDLDSDGDGCSDANEFYINENADGGDGGEYGTGAPVVDPTDGTVNAATYVRVFAPEILLGNTTEDLSGADVNGQELNLGQSYKYVLRFQNTGDDDATNFTISDILPSNITIDNIDISNALGTTSNPDLVAGTIDFTIPDNLVEVGDPMYWIEIEFTIDSSCSSFVDACSSQLENRAYVTYQGLVNTSVFTDENGSNSISGCPRTPEVAVNSVLDALANCSEPRTDLLCGEDALLTAGQGFVTYQWYLDTNGNGQVDAGIDTPLNDDPDSNPSTYYITAIGTYMVEKTSNGSCPDLVEVINVQSFGTTQTNPIVDYFNQVNGDVNPDNDIQGEIRTDCNDGTTQFVDIFLCGTTDSALLQMNITDASGGIFWEKLDETTCTVEPDGCLTTNLTCTWNEVGTGNNYDADTAGKYRLLVTYANGCFSRFYFNVFRNELNFIVPTPTDILCNSDGNIRITGVGADYGFQLVNVNDDSIVVPFSANNGPNFDIAVSGTYRVEMTQLHPMDGSPEQGTPIVGACIFETEDIGIQEQIFDATVSSTPADCNQLGTISVAALNARPNYTYELIRVSDGSSAGLVAAVNDNTHTFLNVSPGDYTVITSTQDGCSISRDITVDEIPELTLGAVTSENITCTPGVVNLTPAGGLPSPEYEMAIWSINGNLQHGADQTAVPDSAFDPGTTILFGDTGNPNGAGEYIFIVRDGNGCFDLSPTVRVEDLGTLSISATNSAIVCADSATAILTVTVTGGTAPYQYSLDGGATYQNPNEFANMAAGFYTITVMDSSGSTGTGCVENFDYEITQPFRLLASPAIIEDASCNASGALVKIMNPSGGQAPYQYSFNGGTPSATDSSYLLPGNHQFTIQDALGCTYDMELTVPVEPTTPSFSNTVTYDCDGLGTITVNPSNTTDFDYSYALNSTPNTPVANNVFAGVSNGSHSIDINYSSTLASTQSTLFFENFGAGPTTQIAEIGPDYCYEPQDGSTVDCNRGPAGILVNGEYTVTNFVTNANNLTRLTSPEDHTGLTDGRFLAIDISTFSDTGLERLNTILWAKRDIEVLPNREIDLNFWAYNLMNTSGAGNNPQVLVEILDNSGNIIYSETTAVIPKNNTTVDWHPRSITFDPGANTDIDIVFRSNINSNDGNDLVLDDIQASQELDVCGQTANISVVVEDNKEFSAQLLGTTDPSCPTGTDGSVRFEVLNFPIAGFRYSTDGTNWTTSTVSEVTTTTPLAAGTYTMQIESLPLSTPTSCTTDFTFTLTDPTAIVPSLSQTADYTCFNTGGTLEASATGGTAGYLYQIEDMSSVVVRPFQSSGTFINVPDGEYVLRAQDAKFCEVVTTTSVTIDPPETVVFDLTPTDCYSGSNDGSISVNVTGGNGNYEFRINNGSWSAWTAPIPATATTHIFTGLSNGSYDVEVRDQKGCPVASNAQTVVINPQLVVSVDVVPLSACGNGSITINATGGNNTLLYAIVPANTSPTGLYSATNTLPVTEAMAIANPGGYDVYVQDNNGAPELCNFIQEDIILTPVTALSVNAVPTDPECFDGLGLIDVTVGGGTAPYTYALVDLSPGDGIDYGRSNANVSSTNLSFNGIGVGNYEVTITDESTCTVTSSTVTINNGVEITADLIPILPANCDDPSNTSADYGFSFDNVVAPTGTLEYSDDWGTSWQLSNELRNNLSGTEVFPSIRVEISPGVYCQKDFDRYIIPFPLDNLSITFSAIVANCNDLQVTVMGTQGNGIPGYQYTYTDDEANFNTFAANPAVWTPVTPAGTSHTFQNINPTTPPYPGVPLLIPGRTYRFYVRDASGCIRFSEEEVNEIPGINLPIEVTTDITPSCDGSANGAITFNLNPSTSYPNMRWEIYRVGTVAPIETSGGNVSYNNIITPTTPLSEGDYYIDIIQIEADNITEACRGASENVYVPELPAINATAVPTRDISCNLPGLISINGISGGGGAPYTYNVSGPVGFTTLTGTADNPIQIPVNSPAGTYTVTLYDQYSCSFALNSVALALAPNPTLTVTQDNCASPISLTAVGLSAAGNFRYAIVTGGSPAPTTFDDNGGIFSNVSPGSYDVYVIDGNGCTNSQAGFTVDPVFSASASLSKLLDCTASPEAEIDIEITDGSGNYEYSITNTVGAPPVGQTSVPSTNFTYQAPVGGGNYIVTIYDTATPNTIACNRQFTINVPDRMEPIIDPAIVKTDVTCATYDDGIITISTTNSAAAPYDFEITSMDGNPVSINYASTTGTSATFTGLAPTTTAAGYIVTVTGNATTNGCSVDSASIIIAEPDTITFDTPVVTPFGCTTGNSENNATIALNTSSILGGSLTYTNYQFEEVTSGDIQNGTSPNYIFTKLTGGDVIVRVFDDKGCVGEITVNVPEFDQLITTVITIVDPISCTSSGEDISIDVTSSLTNFGSDPNNYEFRLLPSTIYEAPGDNTFNNLTPDTYTFGVRNINTGCEITFAHTVSDPNTFNVTSDVLSDVICHGDNGSVRFNITDATYTGDFELNIYNTEGTPIDDTDDTLEYTDPNVALGQTPAINIPAGSYLVEVIQNGFPTCPQYTAFTITTPTAEITLDSIDVEHASCDDNQGTALIKPLGGDGPYDITITNTRTGIVSPLVNHVYSNLFQGLSWGVYTVDVTDALGCPATFVNAFEIVLPDPISGNLTAGTLNCEGDTDATVEFVLDAGRNVTPNYSYILRKYSDASKATLISFTASQTSPIFNNQGAGFYTIFVEDDMGCFFENALPVEILNPTEVIGTLELTQPLGCSVDAELQLTAAGGSGIYEWSADGINFNAMNGINGPNTHVFQNVTDGTYQYFIQDSFDCDARFPTNEITINAIVDLTVAPVDASINPIINCYGEYAAVIDWIADGGLGNYQYGLFRDALHTDEVRPYQDSGTFADLPAGTYYVHVQSGDCEVTSAAIIITEPNELVVIPEVTNIRCYGDGDGRVEFDVSEGTAPYQFAISPNLMKFVDDNSFENLTVGSYTVIVQDANNCIKLVEFEISEPTELVITDLTTTPEICAGEENGTITVAPNGGTPPYSTALNSDDDADFVLDRPLIENLASGDYWVYVKDANGCIVRDFIRVDSGANLTAREELIIECDGDTPTTRVNVIFEDPNVESEVLLALDSTDPNDLVMLSNFENLTPGDHYIYMLHENGCPNTINFTVEEFEPLELSLEQIDLNEITATATGGNGVYTYYFDGQNNNDDNTFYIRRTDTYVVRVVDENGCEATASIDMEFIDIEIPNFFTPDGDGLNDFWIPRNITQFPEIFIKIYDRYGREVHRIQDTEKGWDGLYQEADLPTGDYWYVIRLNGEEDDREFVGNFTLYR